jgi:hypothetical protein
MKAGLVGYAQSGKTTLFNALTGLHKGPASRVNLGAIKVPDARVDRLSAIFKPKKTTYAELQFVDLPGPQSKGAGFDGDALKALREADALCLVLRAYPGADGVAPDPLRELRDFESELLFADLTVVDKRIERMKKEHAKPGDLLELERLLAHLNEDKPLRVMKWSDAEEKSLATFGFLSRRPMVVAVNVGEEAAAAPAPAAVLEEAKKRGAETIALSAAVEAEIAELAPEEQGEFLASLGLTEPARARFIRAAYHVLDYISFFTVGEDEVKAWTVHRGDRAPRAAGRVHTDIERGFIRAEVTHYDDFIACGSEHKARELGKLRLEGKEYAVQDGDIIHFRFAV